MKKPIEIVNEMIELVKKSDELNKVDPETKLPGTLLDKNNEKGVHPVSPEAKVAQSRNLKDYKGMSTMGRKLFSYIPDSAKEAYSDVLGSKRSLREGVSEARSVLKELKAMPKPNLPKSEEMAKEETLYSPSEVPANHKQPVPLNKDAHSSLKKIVKHCQLNKSHEKGVHQRVSADIAAGSNPHNKNMSRAGVLSRWGSAKTTSAAKDIHKDKLQELKAMPKPNLPKSEEMAKADIPSKEEVSRVAAAAGSNDKKSKFSEAMENLLGAMHIAHFATHMAIVTAGPPVLMGARIYHHFKNRPHAEQKIAPDKPEGADRVSPASPAAKPNLPKPEQMAKAEDLNKVSDAQRAKGYGKTSYFSNMIAEQKAAKVGTPTANTTSTPAIKPVVPTTKPTTVHHPDISGKVDYKAPKKLAASESATPHKDTIKKIIKSCQMITKNNPDEKADAKLGENVENLVENHMLENKAAEIKEGHKIFDKDKKNG